MNNVIPKQLLITKNHFKNYFKRIDRFIFKSDIEIEEYLKILTPDKNQEALSQFFDECKNESSNLEINDDFLENELENLIYDNPDDLKHELEQWNEIIKKNEFKAKENAFLIYKIISNKFKNFLQKKFLVDFHNFYDLSNSWKINISDEELQTILSKNENVIIYGANLAYQNYIIQIDAIVKFQEKIIIIEKKFSTSSKLENIYPLIFIKNMLDEKKIFLPNIWFFAHLQFENFLKGEVDFILTPFVSLTKTPPNQTNLKSEIIYNSQIKGSLALIEALEANNHPQKDFLLEILEFIKNSKIAKPTEFVYQKINKHGELTDAVISVSAININRLFNLPYNYLEFELSNPSLREEEIWYKVELASNYYIPKNKKGGFSETTIKKINFFHLLIQLAQNKKLKAKWETQFNSFLDSDLQSKTSRWEKIKEILEINYKTELENPNPAYKLTRDELLSATNKAKLYKVLDTTTLRKIITAFYPEYDYAGVVKRVDPVVKVIINEPEDKVSKKIKSFFYALEDFNPSFPFLISQSAHNQLKEYHKRKRKIYYDFESFQLPFSGFDNTKPYTQIVNQISLIDSDNLDNSTNLVYDPKSLKIEHYKEIIDLIYCDGPDNVFYIVYNKSFENSRLKEMAALLNTDEYYSKVSYIIKNTFDLKDFFSWDKKCIISYELKGFSSIKKILKLIPKDLLEKAKAVDYHSLEKIQNGLVCQGVVISRFLKKNLNNMTEKEWKEDSENMKKYCENDVRTMIALEFFLERLIDTHKQLNKGFDDGKINKFKPK